MANPEHLEILKKRVKVWNEWRWEHRDVRPELRDAVLSDAKLRGADLTGADLTGAYFKGAYLRGTLLASADLAGANFTGANLTGADLIGANLTTINLKDANLRGAYLTDVCLTSAHLGNAYLRHADLAGADLRKANLTGAYLGDVTLVEAKLSGANLSGTNLSGADLRHADLEDTNFTNARLGYTTLADNDLRKVKGLETVKHSAPSYLSIDTLYKAEGKIPGAFLRGCGLSDWQVENAKLYNPELSNEEITNILYQVHDLRAGQAIQISPLFISYSHADSNFVGEVESHLNMKGIRFWRDVHHSTAGRLERQIDHAIRVNPTVLLVLSEQSVKSDWVEHEARLARKLEQETGRDVLCPVALDDRWKTCRWPERLREQIMEYNILDFSNWKDADYMQRMFMRLIEGLGLFYKSEALDVDTPPLP
jgi:uncharacterized protein YjbI with pentapeptide repeats